MASTSSTPSGTVSVGKLSVSSDSLSLNQLQDVSVSNAAHNDVLIYKDSAEDSSITTTGWYSSPFGLNDLHGVEVGTTTAVSHNEVLAYNLTDSSVPQGWVNRNITSLFTGLETTISGIVNSANSVLRGKEGNSGLTDMVVMSSEPSNGDSSINISIASSSDHNVLSKRELTDTEYHFLQTLSKGQVVHLNFPTGTLLTSTKGIYGFSGPFPTPLGMPSMSFKIARFNTNVPNTEVQIASSGTEVTVTLFEGDGVTLSDGPTTIGANNIVSLSCSGTGEFVVVSSGYVLCNINGNGSNLRVLPPMSSELIVWNRGCTISSLTGTASVTWYRRTGLSGTESVSAGTPLTFTAAGSNANFAPAGCVILRSDKPISCFTDDGSGGSVGGWPLDQLAQSFPNPGYIDNDTSYGVACIAIGSPYEGSASVYDSSDNLVDSFTYTRTNSATSADDQLYPAAGRWKPSDVSSSTLLDGGYVITTTPAVCVMTFNGSGVWTDDAGHEMMIAGTTPSSIKADICRDESGLLRLRGLDGNGNVTWTVC